MFDFVRTHSKLMLGLLVALVIPSFVFFGVQGYSGFNDGENAAVAEVGGVKITLGEWNAAHREQSENLRRQAPGIDPALLDAPEARYQTLEQLVRQRVLAASAQRLNLSVSDAQLQRELLQVPQLAALRRPDGSIDTAQYRALLQAQGLTPERFEASVRQEATLRRVLAGVGTTATGSSTSARLSMDAVYQERQITFQRFLTSDYAGSVKPTDEDVQAYYKANESAFKTPESADIEYLVLDAAAIQQGISLSEDDLRKYYEENLSRYTKAEERRARHILIKADAKAPADEKAKAKARAEALLAEVRQNPGRFAEVAKARSEDPGSAASGGDLDYFGRGAMVKPFEDAAFAMKVGEISNLVESDFGFHIIKLDDVRGGQKQPFDKVRAEIETTIRQQQAQRRYAELAEQFSNTVYEQSDSLQPAADKFRLKLQKATVLREPQAGVQGPLASAKLLSAVFADDAVKNKRNTDAVETGQSQLVSARVVQHRPAAVLPLDQVRAAVVERVRAEQALAQAKREGQALVDKVKAAPATLDGRSLTLSRAKGEGQPPELVEAVLKADASKLPAVFGVELGRAGYAVVRLDAVKAPEIPAEARAQWTPRLAQAWAAAETQFYYEALKKRAKAEVKAPKPAASAPVGG